MDPITGIFTAIGIGMQLFGGAGALSSGLQESTLAKQEAGVSAEITQLQGQENAQRQLAAQAFARRQQVEVVRQTQMKKAQALSAGVAQGAQFSSSVAGGQAQAQSEGAFNLQGINQNEAISNNIFGLQAQVTGQQVTMAGLQGQMATLQGQQSMYQGLASIGGSLARSSGPLGSLLGNFFGNSSDPALQGGTGLQGGMGLYGGAQTGSLY